MKKQIIIILLLLIGWMSGSGQKDRETGNRSGTNIEINDLSGFKSPCDDDLNVVAGELKALIQNGGNEIKCIVEKVYPPSVYMKQEAGANAMAIVTKKNIADQYPNYILVLVQITEKEVIDIELVINIPNANLPTDCVGNIDMLKETLNKTLREKLGEGTSAITNVECATKEMFITFKEKVQTGCNFDGNDRRAWFEAQGFEAYNLGPVKLDFGSAFRPKSIIDSSRDFCVKADYTQGELKYSISGSGLALISSLVSDQVSTTFKKRIILTDQKVSPSLYPSIYNDEMLEPICEVTIWLHFEQGFDGGEDEVFVQIARQNKPPSTSGCYTYNTLQEKYKLDPNFFNYIPRIDFRFYDYKDEIVSLFENSKGNPFIPRSNIADMEAWAGLSCGFLDGMIEAVDLLQVICTASAEFNKMSNPSSALWWTDLYTNINQKRNFYEAFNEKWNETYKNWNETFSTIGTFITAANCQPFRQIVAELFYEAMVKAAGNYIDELLFHGSFESNYTIGKTIFNLVPLTAYTKGAKGASTLLASEDVVRSLSKNIGESLDGPTAKGLLK